VDTFYCLIFEKGENDFGGGNFFPNGALKIKGWETMSSKSVHLEKYKYLQDMPYLSLYSTYQPSSASSASDEYRLPKSYF